MIRYLFIYFLSFSLLFSAPNTILILMDGTSQSSFYQLLKKDELPHIQEIIDRGNTRTLSGLDVETPLFESYRALWSGQTDEALDCSEEDPVPNGYSVFEKLEETDPSIQTGYILSALVDIGQEEGVSLSALLSEVNMTLGVAEPDIHRSSREIASTTIQSIETLGSPFFIVVNFTNVDYIGRRYREGAEMYSLAIKNCDKAIGNIIESLKEHEIYDDTEIIVVSTFGMEPKSQNRDSETWIASTLKVHRKGTLYDIVPSIVGLYTEDKEAVFTEYPGTSLFEAE